MGYRLECLCMILLAQLHRTFSVEFKVLGPVGDIVAVAGEDVILPCYLKPAINAVDSRVKWNHQNTVIHHYQDRTDKSERQNPSYKERTALFKDELKQGNTSLKLKGVKISDEGIYICLVQYMGSFDDFFMKVIVTVIGSQPVISTQEKEKGTVGLECEAKGWYPEPELVWQDSKEQTLTTGPPEIHRDPEDPKGPYTVISRIVVPEGDNIFTCRVHMKLINHTKKAEIHTTGGPVAPVNYMTMVLPIVIVVLFIVLTIFCIHRTSGETEFGRIKRLYAVDVTLNPHTAPPALHISDNGKKVLYEATPENGDCCLSVLGKEKLCSGGKYYFEVQVNRSNEYALGVSKGSAGDNCVTAELKGGGFWSMSKKPLKVGIYVENDVCGQVSFYNVKKKTLIQSYSCQKFENEIIYPYFKLGKEKGNALIITPVRPFTSFASLKPQFRRQSYRECGTTSHIGLQPINQQASVNLEEICSIE